MVVSAAIRMGPPVRNHVAPTSEKGMENRIAKGWTSDSKSEAMST